MPGIRRHPALSGRRTSQALHDPHGFPNCRYVTPAKNIDFPLRERMPHIDIAALRHMGLRKITHTDLKYVPATGDAGEEYADNQPDPKVLFMAHVQGEPLYVSCAFGGNCVYIITVQRYDAAKWPYAQPNHMRQLRRLPGA
jgi:hypothetical protein